jgi:uncharacterized protein (DUF885 family)
MVDEPTKFEAPADLVRRASSGGRLAMMGAIVGVVYMLSIWAAPVLAEHPTEAQDEASVATKALWQAVSEGDPARQTSAGPVVPAEGRRQLRERDERLLARIDAIDPRVLNPEDRFVHELLRYHLRRHIEGANLRPEVGPYLQDPRLLPAMQRFPQPAYGEDLWPGGYSPLTELNADARAEAFDTLLRRYTTADVTGAVVHDAALAAVGKSREAMRHALSELGYTGSLDQFLAADFGSGQYKTRAGDVERRSTLWLRRIADLLPALFSLTPPLPSVQAIDRGIPIAMYRPQIDDGQPAALIIDRTFWATPTILPLVLHEALPGHHLQHHYGSRAPLPSPAAYLESDQHGTGFREGWAFYAESLAPELGLVRAPADEFGIAYLSLLREVRAATDTGVHLHGWSTARARDYMREMLQTTPQAIDFELSRIRVPGAGAVYFVGRQAIANLRERAESRAGAAFELRAFHDWLLTGGALPLVILEERFDACLRSSVCAFEAGSTTP